jgi:ABC-type branched-subunit amino acid transport system substrate-binding protein
MRRRMQVGFLAALGLLALALSACVTTGEVAAPSPATRAVSREPMASRSTPPVLHGPEGAGSAETLERFPAEEIRIALLVPLSGPTEALGQAFLDSAAMALFEAFDPRLKLLPIDTLGTPEGAERAMREALAEKVELVLGPIFSEDIRRTAPLARAAGIPVIGFSNDAGAAGNGVYLLSFFPEQEVARVVDFAAGQGYRAFGALIPDSPYGEEVLASFSNAVYAGGGEIAGLEIYERQPNAFTEPVKRLANYDSRHQAYLEEEKFLKGFQDDDLVAEILKRMEKEETLGEAPFDAVLVPEGGQLLRSLIPLLPYYEIDPAKVRFLGTGLWHDPTLPGEPTLSGAWFAGADPKGVEAFMTNFKTLYGYRPPRIATLAYDAVALAASLATLEIRRTRFSAATLEDPNGFSGVDGLFRFRADGTNERALAVLQIGRTGFKVVSPAAESFLARP